MRSKNDYPNQLQEKVLDVVRNHWIKHLTPPPSMRYIVRQIYGPRNIGAHISTIFHSIEGLERLGMVKVIDHGPSINKLVLPTEFIPGLEKLLREPNE